MNDAQTVAIVILIVALAAIYLHSQGKLIPIFNVLSGQTITTSGPGQTLVQTLVDTAIRAIGGK